MNPTHPIVVVLDYGSQYTQLIARRVRELGVYSVILPCDVSGERIEKLSPKAIILSGGPSSVYEAGAPLLSESLMVFQKRSQIPLLGICYGMQLLAQKMGGEVKGSHVREYGPATVIPIEQSVLFRAWKPAGSGSPSKKVWMSHGDSVGVLPKGFVISAKSESGAVAAIENAAERIYGLQFHPEVTHSEGGMDVLRAFVLEVAQIKPDWNMKSVLDEQVEKIRTRVGPKEHVICALSGGVDSAVAAVLVHKAIGDRLHCFFVDQGLLRYQEQQRVMQLFQTQLGLPVTCLDHSEIYLEKLKGVVDPERKRKIIGAEFIQSFEVAAQAIAKAQGSSGSLPKFLVQGTLYPDVIESSPGHKNSVTIKSHHNVGGLPENLRFQLIEPLRDLFKDEVRALGKELKVPEDFLKRHPFPGPGLAVRVIGEITKQNLETLRAVDEIFINALREENLYDRIWQAFAVFLPIRTVGVQGDGRTHDHVVALRAVSSSDGMTADWFPLPSDFLGRVSAKICNQVKGVSRVVYDVTSKPPSTIEWE